VIRAWTEQWVDLSKRDFMSVMQNLLAGFPDLTFGLHDVQTVDDQASFFLHINGTNTQDIPSLFSGMPPIKATGKPVHLPEEPCTATFRGDKIREITVETVPGAGIQGLLEQLGVQIPLGLETPISSPVASTAG
jgi:hypothetical protein